MTGHFPSWSRRVYIQWSQYQKFNIFVDHIDKMKLHHRLWDVFMIQHYFWRTRYAASIALSHRSWNYRRHPPPPAKSQEAPQVLGQVCTETRNNSWERSFPVVTSELSPERWVRAHLVQGEESGGGGQETQNSKMLSSCSRAFRQQGRRTEGHKTLGLAAKGKWTLSHKPSRATETHIYGVTPAFQGNKNRVYQVRFLGNGKRKACDEMLSQNCSSSFTTEVFYKPQSPKSSTCSLQSNPARLQETTYIWSVSHF